MIWFIKIIGEDYKSQRIRIEYLPHEESVLITGEYKFNSDWIDFSNTMMTAKEPSIEEIREKIEETVIDMQKKIAQHQNLDKGFSVWKEVEYREEQED